jgi:hypothetical protein
MSGMLPLAEAALYPPLPNYQGLSKITAESEALAKLREKHGIVK